jgi:hypothetical protein
MLASILATRLIAARRLRKPGHVVIRRDAPDLAAAELPVSKQRLPIGEVPA